MSKQNRTVDFEGLWLKLTRTTYKDLKKRNRPDPELYTETNPPQGNGHELGSRGNFPKRRQKQGY